jgi:hypothetical protein
MWHVLTLLVGLGLGWLIFSGADAAIDARAWLKRQTWDRVF